MSEAPLFDIGEIVAGNYEIRSVLGEGGMGRVYAAHDVALNRKVALKASWPSFDPAMLLKEAQALASIRHPGMIDVYAAGTHRGVPFLVMEHLYGVDVATFLARRRGDSGALGIDEVLDLLIPVADALGAVHRSGMTHRDVKPANVMLTPNGRIVLMDFGLFQPESEADPFVSGTPEYMGPETLMGRVDPRNAFLLDIYALGITAYELIVGDLPFRGDTPMEVLSQHMRKGVPDVRAARPDVPLRLASLVQDMLAKEPTDRPSSMEAVLFHLRAVRELVQARAHAPARERGKLDILVVDDDPAIAKLVGMYATRAVPESSVLVVGDAERALASVRERPPHVMLLDLQMPRINGIELCMMLRGMHLADDCAVIAVSAGAQEGDIELLRQLGITRFVSKGPQLGASLTAELRAIHRDWLRAELREVAANAASAGSSGRTLAAAPATSGKVRVAKEVRSSPRVEGERLCKVIARELHGDTGEVELDVDGRRVRVRVARSTAEGCAVVVTGEGDEPR